MLIGNISIEHDLVLAPLASFTDTTFRRKIKEMGGCGLLFSEMISIEALRRGVRKTLRMLEFTQNEKPIAIQIVGCHAGRMAEAARMIEDKGADIIDINMGCPSRRVVRTGAGCALLNDLPLAGRIIETIVRSVSIPVTIKIRAGWEKGDRKGMKMAMVAQESGASAMTVHPRYRRDSLREKADWSLIGEIKSTIRIPVIGNGDIKEAEDAIRMKKETDCDGVMIGRAALYNPWIFRQIEGLRKGRKFGPPTLADRKRFAQEHLQLLLKYEEERMALHRMKTFAGYYFKGFPGGHLFRRRIQSIRSSSEFLKEALDYLS